MSKKILRLKRSTGIRKKISKYNIPRFSIYKSNKNIYCQIFSINKFNIITSISTIDFNLKKYILLNFGKNIILDVCDFIGRCIAFQAISLGIYTIVFDRSGYKYHGCIKCLADSARKYGLNF